jgi:hypothetical protein
MADDIRHARAISPWFIPNKGGVADDLHGLSDVGADPSVGSEDVYVVGKKAKCGTDKETPEVTVPLSQLERGEIDTYLTLANVASEPSGGFDLLDFNSSLTDVVYYIKDEFNGNVDASMWMPKCAVNSITLNIDDPEARITRDIELAGDDRRVLTGDNKYLIHVEDTAPSGTSGNYVIDVSDPVPIEDPNNAGIFILRIDRTRSGTTDTLALTTDYTFNDPTDEITIISALAGDVYNIYYSASSFGSAGDPTSVDNDSICFLKAENVTVLISDGTTEVEMDRLSSLTLTATLNRIDENVIGNDERVLREISDTPVTVDFSGRVKNYNGEKAFMNQLADSSIISSVKLFNDNVKVTIKIYDNADKDTFLIGYQVDNLSYTDGSFSATANEFATMDVSAQSDDVLITETEGNL